MTRGFALLSLALALVAAGVVPLLHHFDAIPTELQPHLSGALALIPAAANGTAATEAPAVRIGGGAFAAAFVLYVVSLFVRRYVFAAILDTGRLARTANSSPRSFLHYLQVRADVLARREAQAQRDARLRGERAVGRAAEALQAVPRRVPLRQAVSGERGEDESTCEVESGGGAL